MSRTDAKATIIEPQVATAVELSGDPGISAMLHLVEDLSRADDAQQVLRVFAEGMRQLQKLGAYLSLSTRGLGPGEYKITRFMPDIGAAALDKATDPWATWQQIPVRRGGLLGKIVSVGRPVILHDLRLHDDPAVGDMLAAYGSLEAIPLFDQGRALNWAVQLQTDPKGFALEELAERILRSNLVGGTVRNVLIAQKLREANAWIQNEVDQIAEIQRALLPERTPDIPGLTIATHYQTFDRAGGDMYDFESAGSDTEPDSRWAILVADASGHGPAASVVTAMLHALVHTYPRRPEGPAEVLEFVNHHLFAKQIASTFVTAFLGLYQPATRALSYSTAGHPPALLKQSPGPGRDVVRLEEATNLPLGVLGHVGYQDASVTLEPGQTLVLYTDGIIEANGPGGQMFGVQGIERAVADCSGDPGCIVSSITDALKLHQGGEQPDDDQTIVAMQVNEA
ncbi:MAG: PP2C family protein-serine/threonine phosphatase [Phycisphaeraceae bacterium]